MDNTKLYYHQRLLQRKMKIIKNLRIKSVVHPVEIRVSKEYKTDIIEDFSNIDLKPVNLPYKYGGIDNYLITYAYFDNLDPAIEYMGSFDFGFGSGGLTVGSETLMYLNGIEKSGIDVNHQEVAIGKVDGTANFTFRTWTGIADESRIEELSEIQGKRDIKTIHTISKIELFVLNKIANNLYYNVRALLEGYETIKETDYINGAMIINDLSEILLSYDDSDIINNLDSIDSDIQELLDGYRKNETVKMIAVGQTHIDVAWLWRIKHTREKIARSFSTMLNLMDNNKQFTFLQSQPVLFEFLKKDYPQIYQRIKQSVVNGQLEVDGAMYLEADCNIPSGESLIRQVLYGKQFIKQEFGHDSKLLWMPDVFGYSSALPQILKQANIDTFCTTKMQWNQANRMPSNTFLWQGLDGSRVTTHLIEDFDLWKVTGETMRRGWENYKDKHLTNEIIYQHGFGDGGGGPTQTDIEMVKRLDKVPGLPNIEYGLASEYFERLNKSVIQKQSTIQKWHGEMYLELHRGTFTSQAKMKYYNRKIEYRLRYIEMLTVKVAALGVDVTTYKEQLKDNWKLLMINQFHDIIPGSSIHDVHVDAVNQYVKILFNLEKIEEQLLNNFPQRNDMFSVFNGYHLPMNTTITIDFESNAEFYCGTEKLDSYYYEGTHTIVVNSAKALAFTPIKIKKCDDISVKVVQQSYEFENEFYKIRFNKIGQIDYYYDKELKKQLITPGNVFNKLVSYEDKPLDWDAWDIDIFYDKNPKVVDDLRSFEVIVSNEIETVIKIKFDHFDSKIVETITLSNISKRIDFSHKVDWQNSHRLLRVLFETDIIADNARFDTQLGNVLRPTHRNTSWDQQRFEVVGHKWSDISNNSYGVSILSDCKYGYNANENVLGMSLIKASKFPDLTQDLGEHQYTYSLYVHENDVLDSSVDIEAYKLNCGLQVVNKVVDNKPLLSISNSNIYIDAIKLAENSDDVVVRYHEHQNKCCKLDMNIDYTNCNLLEEVQSEKDTVINSYQVKTNLINLELLKENH